MSKLPSWQEMYEEQAKRTAEAETRMVRLMEAMRLIEASAINCTLFKVVTPEETVKSIQAQAEFALKQDQDLWITADKRRGDQ